MRASVMCLIFLMAVLSSGCGTMNSNFSCNATAGDSCLSIEQVDAMTRFADDARPALVRQSQSKIDAHANKPQGHLVKLSSGQSVWVTQQSEAQSWA
ncbi:conjugal transfer protein (plasmid) [Legionella sp. D16C41]